MVTATNNNSNKEAFSTNEQCKCLLERSPSMLSRLDAWKLAQKTLFKPQVSVSMC